MSRAFLPKARERFPTPVKVILCTNLVTQRSQRMPAMDFLPIPCRLEKTRLPSQRTRPARSMVPEYPCMRISSTFLRRSSTRSIQMRMNRALSGTSVLEPVSLVPFLASEKR
uniref:Uncharacterized protein n=1 Tax=Arundo donax TaxID=35708 RepID=A0A0A8YS26_ARUDO